MADLSAKSEARFSDCGTYRLMLSRRWARSERRPWLGWIMLNPSTADAVADDATIRRCSAFAANWGYGGIWVANLFMFRATSPEALARAKDPVGAAADEMIRAVFVTCPVVVAAWGVHGTLHGRDQKVLALIRDAGWMPRLHCLGRTKEGHPRHPQYVPACTPLAPF